jgi:hypothetical protein
MPSVVENLLVRHSVQTSVWLLDAGATVVSVCRPLPPRRVSVRGLSPAAAP